MRMFQASPMWECFDFVSDGSEKRAVGSQVPFGGCWEPTHIDVSRTHTAAGSDPWLGTFGIPGAVLKPSNSSKSHVPIATNLILRDGLATRNREMLGVHSSVRPGKARFSWAFRIRRGIE
jgi:hypothetical protein